eukprot:53445_1
MKVFLVYTIILIRLLSAKKHNRVFHKYWVLNSPTEVHNARNSDLSFEENGFMLIKNQSIIDALNTDLDSYDNHIVSTFRQLFPKAKAVQLTKTVYRGTEQHNGYDNGYGKTVHFDYGWSTKESVAATYPHNKEYQDLVLTNDTLWIIGVWTPVQMKTNICKNSLALLDMNTLLKEDIKPFHYGGTLLLADGTTETTNGSSAHLLHNSNHKWYYYPQMKNDETIIFTHYRSDAWKKVAHAPFTPNDCGDNTERRKSIESRVLITFENECVSNINN